jgi:hypothetical protein
MNGDKPRSLLPHSRAERLCAGLKAYEPPSIVKVYKANTDGTVGEFLRIEAASYYEDMEFFPRTAGKIRSV